MEHDEARAAVDGVVQAGTDSVRELLDIRTAATTIAIGRRLAACRRRRRRRRLPPRLELLSHQIGHV